MLDTSDPDLASNAGWARVLCGLIALTLGPLFLPALGEHRLVFVAYTVAALAVQILVTKRIGGELRALFGGLLDAGILTFLVHRVGSVSTPLTALYIFLAVVTALVHGRRVAFAVAAIACALYTSVLLAEWVHWLPYGPDAPHWAPAVALNGHTVILASVLVWGLVLASTAIVSRLALAVAAREEQLTRAHRELELLSQRDPLTQLFNRRHVLEHVELELARVRRGHRAALLMIDLDAFKVVNDQYGHQRGDDMLRHVAKEITDATRVTDVAGRYGADEFVVVLSDSDELQAERVATRLVEAVQKAGEIFGMSRPVTASVGVAIASGDDDARGLVRRADAGAYRAKQLGGNRVVHEHDILG